MNEIVNYFCGAFSAFMENINPLWRDSYELSITFLIVVGAHSLLSLGLVLGTVSRCMVQFCRNMGGKR